MQKSSCVQLVRDKNNPVSSSYICCLFEQISLCRNVLVRPRSIAACVQQSVVIVTYKWLQVCVSE